MAKKQKGDKMRKPERTLKEKRSAKKARKTQNGSSLTGEKRKEV